MSGIKILALYSVVLPFLHLFILWLFALEEYLLYFTLLFVSLLLLFKLQQFLKPLFFIYYGAYLLLIYAIFFFLKEHFYQYLLDLEINFSPIFPSLEVVYVLSLFHFLILFLLSYNSFRKI